MTRSWFRLSVILMCLVPFIGATQFSRADEIAAGEKLLPKDTLVFTTISNVPELKKKWDKSSMGQLIQEPQMKPFIDDVTKKIEESLKEAEDELGVPVNDLLELPQGELTFALLERPAGKISVVLILQYGDRQSTVDKLLKEMDDGLEKLKFEHSSEEIGKLSVHKYSLKGDGADNPFKTVVYFTDKSSLVLSTEVESIKEVIERWDGRSDDTLADNEQYKYIQAQCKTEAGEPMFKLFVNPIGLIQSGISMAQASFPQVGLVAGVIPMLGLDGLKGWGGASDFDEGDFEWVANFFTYNEDSKGLMGVFNFPSSELAPPKWVPATVASYFIMNWNVQGAYKSIETLLDTFQGRGATARLLDSYADKDPGIHWKKDLMDHLDGKIHFIQNEPKEAEDGDLPPPGFFAGFGLKDAAKMKKTLAVAAKANGSNLETREFNGETIYETNPQGDEPSISCAVTEGTLVFTNDTQLLEGVIRGQSGRGMSLADSPDYKKVAKFFPSKTSMISFQRSELQMKMYYDLAKNAGSEAVDGIDFSKLPPFDVIARYLVPSGSYIIPDKKGAKSVSFSLRRGD